MSIRRIIGTVVLGASVLEVQTSGQAVEQRRPVPQRPKAPVAAEPQLTPGRPTIVFPERMSAAELKLTREILDAALTVALADPEVAPSFNRARMYIHIADDVQAEMKEVRPGFKLNPALDSFDAFTVSFRYPRGSSELAYRITLDRSLLEDFYRFVGVLHHELVHVEKIQAGEADTLSEARLEVATHERSIRGLRTIRAVFGGRMQGAERERFFGRVDEQIARELKALEAWRRAVR